MAAADLQIRCGGCGKPRPLDGSGCPGCGASTTVLVKVKGPPDAVADRLARGLAARGYDESLVRQAFVHDVDGVSLPAVGERLDVLLAFLDGMDATYLAWPVGPGGEAGPPATEKAPSMTPLWGGISLVLLALAVVVVLLPKASDPEAAAPDVGPVAVAQPEAVVDAAPPKPDADPLQVLGDRRGVPREVMVRGQAVAVRIETGDGRLGAGTVVSRRHVLTTEELLRNDGKANVRFADGRFEPARRSDIEARGGFALLEVDTKIEAIAELGRGIGRERGEPVFVVGSLGSDAAIRVGEITRPLLWSDFKPFLTTSAGLGPFHEGAPLFDTDGRVMGIVTGGAHLGQRLVMFIETAAEGDTVLGAAGLGRALGDPYTALLSNAEKGDVRPARDGPRPTMTGQGFPRIPERFRRNCPRFRKRFSGVCRSDLEVKLVQTVRRGSRPLQASTAELRFLSIGSDDATHARGSVAEWTPHESPVPSRLRRGRKPGKKLEASVRFSGLSLYRFLTKNPRCDGRYVVRVDGVESAPMRMRLR